MAELNCPNCGYLLEPRFGAAKMTTCASCETTLFLDSGHVQDAGSSGEMHDAPMLFQIGQRVQAQAETFDVLGHARFDYGPGWWDEFFALTESGEEIWVSVDEGDVVVQRPLPEHFAPDRSTPPELGALLLVRGTAYRVTEKDTATCIAVRGEFSEVLSVGATFSYVNCKGDNNALLSGEFSTGAPDWYMGSWLDPYELTL